MTPIPERTVFGLIHAPLGRDAQIAAALLQEAGLSSSISLTLHDVIESLDDDVAFVVITEEALHSADLRPFAAWIEMQPTWSDLPFIILTARGGGPERNPDATRLSEVLGNVSFIERPFHATTFISVAQSAIRGRRRQYEARTRIEELNEGERRLQTALEAGRLGAWELDLATSTLTTSPTCRGIFGRAADDGFTYGDLLKAIHPDDVERMKQAVRDAVARGTDYVIAYRTVWPDGSVHGAEIRAQLHRDRAGRVVKLVGVASDVTERLQAEEQQRHLNEMLEERVAERTRELELAHDLVLAEVGQRERAEEQLRQSQKMEAIGQLTGGVAHDFNNLLMAVLANLDLLRKHLAGDAKAIRLIEGALQGAQRGASLTQRLLAFSRRQDLQVGPVNLDGLVTEMKDLLQRSVGSRIAIEADLPEHLPLVSADANQVELALLNLAVNARDAMPDGGTILVKLRETEQPAEADACAPGRYVVLSVVDQGTGMDPETLQKAIEPFFSTKELGKGTGLGLSMVHGLALQLNGRLKLTSEPGRGTTAELWIPVSTANVIQLEQGLSSNQNSIETGPKKILLVDDDVLIAMSSADMLSDLGHEVVEVYSGKDALALIDSGTSFDLLITDYSMPGMTGAELAKAVHERVPGLPILLASGYADLPSGVEIDAARLAKPYTQDQMAQMLAKIL
ncbi:two-component system sensor histidine kinase/response regulator [Rhizobium sp. Root274]|uniref:hybrid sensor histidine kinase/response regulator n=1 Tax=unclassified Rhizobium TaxID=2613769 RepID=UPI0007145EE9|nr:MULTISPECIES: hybrid sensor histidine kinase/response regulator [unclassified Rhizobium]KQW29691.1 two-component system sensor histidine kinase/response regulator [Rhizobium sp. Root1240]KRD29880.1 two-component system sensor histidine kinase/response regulator [Rhizobium sp. Root274]